MEGIAGGMQHGRIDIRSLIAPNNLGRWVKVGTRPV
jgi:hypothetical protein